MGRDLVEVGDSSEAVVSIVGQTDVEEAGILLGDERVHVATGWSDQQQVVLIQQLRLALLGLDYLFCLKQLVVLII